MRVWCVSSSGIYRSYYDTFGSTILSIVVHARLGTQSTFLAVTTRHTPLPTRNPASPRAQNSNPKGKIGITYKADLVSRISNPCRDRREPVQVFFPPLISKEIIVPGFSHLPKSSNLLGTEIGVRVALLQILTRTSHMPHVAC